MEKGYRDITLKAGHPHASKFLPTARDWKSHQVWDLMAMTVKKKKKPKWH